jgi:hypothetical protein
VLATVWHGFCEVELHGIAVVVLVVSIATQGVVVSVECGDPPLPETCANSTWAPAMTNAPHGLALVGHGSRVVVTVNASISSLAK